MIRPEGIATLALRNMQTNMHKGYPPEDRMLVQQESPGAAIDNPPPPPPRPPPEKWGQIFLWTFGHSENFL